ncbi:MAG: hypothetical protein AAF944_21700 [Bacteroidota bacterium]
MTYRVGKTKEKLILILRAPYEKVERIGLGGITGMVEKPSSLIDSLIVIENQKTIWKIVNVNKDKRFYELTYGKIPKGYIQVIPSDDSKPNELRTGFYSIESFIAGEKLYTNVEIE